MAAFQCTLFLKFTAFEIHQPMSPSDAKSLFWYFITTNENMSAFQCTLFLKFTTFEIR